MMMKMLTEPEVKQQRTSTVTAWILAAVLVFGGSAEMRAAVLCVGDDGHTDIEVLASFCCSERGLPLTHELAPNVIVVSDHCGDCVDLSLGAEYVKASKSGLHIERAAVPRSFDEDPGRDRTNQSAIADSAVRENLQAFHSSVVLLI
jgi:hypothetical protein